MLNFHNSYYAKNYLFFFVVFNQFINQVMKKRCYYFYVAGDLVKVSSVRFFLRKWFHFPLSGYRLVVVSPFFDTSIKPDDLVLRWIRVLSFDFSD